MVIKRQQDELLLEILAAVPNEQDVWRTFFAMLASPVSEMPRSFVIAHGDSPGNAILFDGQSAYFMSREHSNPYEALNVAKTVRLPKILSKNELNWDTPALLKDALPARLGVVRIRARRKFFGVILVEIKDRKTKTENSILRNADRLGRFLGGCIEQCRKVNALQHQVDRLTRLGDVHTKISQELNPIRVAEIASKEIIDRLDCDALTFYLYDDMNDGWRLLHHFGVRDWNRLAPVAQLTDSAVCRARDFLRNRRDPVYVSIDPKQDPILKGRFVREEGIATAFLLRLSVQQRFLGMIFANFRRARRLDHAEQIYLEQFSLQLSIVLSNAVRMEREVRRLDRLSSLRETVEGFVALVGDLRTVYDRIVNAAREVSGATHALLFRLADAGDLVQVSYSGGDSSPSPSLSLGEDSFEASVTRSRRSRMLTDLQLSPQPSLEILTGLTGTEIDAVACLPVMPRADSPHLLVLAFHRKPEDLQELVQTAGILTTSAQAAIDAFAPLAQVDAATRQAVEELNALTLAQGKLAAVAGSNELLGTVFDLLVELTHAPQACVAVYEKESRSLDVVRHTGLNPGASAVLLVDQCLAGLAIERGHPVTIRNEADLQTYGNRFAHVLNPRSLSATIVPALWRGEPLAVLAIESERENAFGAYELGFMERLAPTVAASIYAARQRDELAATALAQQELALTKELLVLKTTIMHDIHSRLIDARAAAETAIRTLGSQPPLERLWNHLTDGLEVMRRRLATDTQLREVQLRKQGLAGILHRSISAAFGAELKTRGVEYHVKVIKDQTILADDYYLGLAFRELMTNSLRHLASGSEPKIEVEIGDEDETHTIMRFRDMCRRSEEVTRSDVSSSGGRGLFFCQHIVQELHGGDITWQLNEFGMQVVLRFPKVVESHERPQDTPP